MPNLPSFIKFDSPISLVLWIEFNLLFLAVWINGYLDLSQLFLIVSLSTCMIIKLIQFVDESAIEQSKENQEIVKPEDMQKLILSLLSEYQLFLNKLASTNTTKAFLKSIAPYLILGSLLNHVCPCLVIWLLGNLLFGSSFMSNKQGVSICEEYLKVKVKIQIQLKQLQQVIPQYKDAKKIQ